MDAAFAQFLRGMAHVCEDAGWHSRCCTNEEGCVCDAETHGADAAPRDIEVHGGTCCWLEAHEGTNEQMSPNM